MATRQQNEKDFPHWEDLAEGGRRYWYDRKGRVRGFQRLIKIVDGNENTLFFFQEIYDDEGRLIEIHQKYPVDTGHQIVKANEPEQDL
ncbi:MAG: hypothetical protein SF029_22355 [bacterium]|nr:hypothetical protein [bacterium]